MLDKKIDISLVGGINKDRLCLRGRVVKESLGGDIIHQLRIFKTFYPDINLGIVSAIGQDVDLKKDRLFDGLDIQGIELMEGKTPFFEINYDSEGKESYLKRELNIAEIYKPDLPENYLSSDFLCFSSLDPDFLLEIKEKFLNKIVFSTVPYWTEIKPDSVKKVIKESFLTILDVKELENLETTPTELLKLVENLIVTYGKEGSIFYKNKEKNIVPAYLIERMVPCGAGDSFKATMIAEMFSGKTLEEALPYASAISSRYVENPFNLRKDDKELEKRVNFVKQGIKKERI